MCIIVWLGGLRSKDKDIEHDKVKDKPSLTIIVRSAPRANLGRIVETWNAWHALSASN